MCTGFKHASINLATPMSIYPRDIWYTYHTDRDRFLSNISHQSNAGKVVNAAAAWLVSLAPQCVARHEERGPGYLHCAAQGTPSRDNSVTTEMSLMHLPANL